MDVETIIKYLSNHLSKRAFRLNDLVFNYPNYFVLRIKGQLFSLQVGEKGLSKYGAYAYEFI